MLAFAIACTPKPSSPGTSGPPGSSLTTPPTTDTSAPIDTSVGSDSAGDSAPTLHGTVPPVSLPLPAFTQVLASDGTARTADDLVGHPTVLWFHPAASTGSSTIEGCGFRDLYTDFQALGVEIVGVSYDSPSANQAFIAANEFKYELWSDVGHELALYYRAAAPADPVPSRVTRVLDTDGDLVLVYDFVSTAENPGEVLADCAVLFP